MGDLKGTLRKWHVERPTERASLVVLICIPTSHWRFTLQSLCPKAIWGLTGLWSDYILQQERVPDYWHDYGAPIVRHLDDLARVGVTVVKDATLQDVARSLAAGKTELLLFGHNPNPDSGGVEFRDGFREFSEIKRTVLQCQDGNRASVYFNVCHSWTAHNDDFLHVRERFGAVPFEVGIKWALLFCLYWIEELDGRTTMYDAWNQATQRYLQDPSLTCGARTEIS